MLRFLRRPRSGGPTYLIQQQQRCMKTWTETCLAKGRVLIRSLYKNVGGRQRVTGDDAGQVSRLLSRNGAVKLTDSLTAGRPVVNSIIGRAAGRWSINSLANDMRRRIGRYGITRGAGLTLGLVGVCVKNNGTSRLTTEFDEIEAVCQEVRSMFSSYLKYHPLFMENVTYDPSKFNLENIRFSDCIAKGCNAVVYNASLKDDNTNGETNGLAVKMMFNYDVESNAVSIWNGMCKECLPFNGSFAPLDNVDELAGRRRKRFKLKLHPNIVKIHGIFADMVPALPDGLALYPEALPARINRCGYGRNMTLFIAMKKYDMTLREYLTCEKPKPRTSLSMLTQLLEGVDFLVKHNVAHRDLKSDNLLLDLSQGQKRPWLVITDFGFSTTSLSLALPSEEICRGGNAALLAPEIICQEPGPFSYLNYKSADLWSAGTIAYEIFGVANPFYPNADRQNLRSATFRNDELPHPPASMPPYIDRLVLNILRRNPNDRPSARLAANLCHIVLHSSARSLAALKNASARAKTLTGDRYINWLMSLASTTLCQRRTVVNGSKLSPNDVKLRLMFLTQVKYQELVDVGQFLASLDDE